MPYAPKKYTTQAAVERMLRTSNAHVRIGNGQGEITPADIDEYILDAGRKIDSYIRSVVLFDNLPVVDDTIVPELNFAATRYAAYFIYTSLYPSYRLDNKGSGIDGWLAEANEAMMQLKASVDAGVYTTLSPAKVGFVTITSEQFFQTQIGVREVNGVKNDQETSPPLKLGNIGPYEDGTH